MSCGIGCRCCSDPTLLWLVATAPIRSQAWELPYAEVAALKKKRQKKKNTPKTKTLKIELLYDAEILLPDIYLKKTETLIQKDSFKCS